VTRPTEVIDKNRFDRTVVRGASAPLVDCGADPWRLCVACGLISVSSPQLFDINVGPLVKTLLGGHLETKPSSNCGLDPHLCAADQFVIMQADHTKTT
jgi:hypothetical protein